MGNCRFIYQNYIADAWSVDSNNKKGGFVTQALKDGTGSAVISVSGAYSGAVDNEYIVECDSTSSGAEVGQATIRYSTGGGAWNSSGIVSGAATLSNDVSIDFSSGAGADFVQGDRWFFKGINYFGPRKMETFDRDSRYRSLTCNSTVILNVTMSSAVSANVVILYDHNLSSNAQITFRATTSKGGGGSPLSTTTGIADSTYSLTTTIPYHQGKAIKFFTETSLCRLWKLTIIDTANTDGYIEIGNLMIGKYFELERNFVVGSNQPINYVTNSAQTPYGVRKSRYYNTMRSWSIEIPHASTADKTNLEDNLLPFLVNKDDGTKNPFYICLDSTNSTETYMVEMDGINRRQNAFNYSYALSLTEVLKSV